MLPWIIQSGLISFILIFLIHYLFTFFKENLTVPKVIDLVNKPKEQYENLLKNTNTVQAVPEISNLLPPTSKVEMSSMKDELKNYLKDLKSKNAHISSSLPESVNIMDTSQFSSY